MFHQILSCCRQGLIIQQKTVLLVYLQTIKNFSNRWNKFSGIGIIVIIDTDNFTYNHFINPPKVLSVLLQFSLCAYIIYTFGSIGKPKDVTISHDALAHCITQQQCQYDLRSKISLKSLFSQFGIFFNYIYFGNHNVSSNTDI